MPKAGPNATTPAGDFASLGAALEEWFEKPFDELPAELQLLVARHFLVPWDSHSPGQRCDRTLLLDIEHHPALAQARDALWEETQHAAEWGRVAVNLPVENRTMGDVVMQATKLGELRAKVAALDQALLQEAERLGLGRLCSGREGVLRRLDHLLSAKQDKVTGASSMTFTMEAQVKSRRRTLRQQVIDTLTSLHREGVDIRSPGSVDRLHIVAQDKAKIRVSKATFERALAAARSLISIKLPQSGR